MPGKQPPHQVCAWDVEVHSGLHLDPEGPSHREGCPRLFDGAREAVEDIAASLSRRHDGLAEHVQDDAIGDQIAPVNIGLDRPPDRRLLPDVLSQQVAAGDVGYAEPLRQ